MDPDRDPDRDPVGSPPPDAVGDDVFAALGDRSRRLALYFLSTRRRVDLDTLADVVTGWSSADSRGAATRADRDHVRATLVEHHLPVLVDAGLVVYDREQETVALADLPKPVRALLDVAFSAEGSGTDAP